MSISVPEALSFEEDEEMPSQVRQLEQAATASMKRTAPQRWFDYLLTFEEKHPCRQRGSKQAHTLPRANHTRHPVHLRSAGQHLDQRYQILRANRLSRQRSPQHLRAVRTLGDVTRQEHTCRGVHPAGAVGRRGEEERGCLMSGLGSRRHIPPVA